LRRLQKIAREIRYGSYEDDSEIDDAIGGAEPPELDAPVECAATVPPMSLKCADPVTRENLSSWTEGGNHVGPRKPHSTTWRARVQHLREKCDFAGDVWVGLLGEIFDERERERDERHPA